MNLCHNLIIGTGFYATEDDTDDRLCFLRTWMNNTLKVCDNVVVVNNSNSCYDLRVGNARMIRCRHNLGHACHMTSQDKFCGWSLSWMLSALVAYADGADFVYKEQDCLAFGNWLPEIQRGGMAFGRNETMPCEQSLFWLRHDHILPVVRAYMDFAEPDGIRLPEQKFRQLMDAGLDVQFFDLPGGRNRPFPASGPFYGQQWQPGELARLRASWGDWL